MPSSLGDEALLAGVRAGSESHFNVLYARYLPRIHRFFCARVSNRADVEELTQEVFTAVFRSADGFGERASPLSWVYGIARNTLASYVRRQQLERGRAERLAGSPPAHSNSEWADTPEEWVRGRRFHAELLRRAARFVPWQREAFRLRYLESMPIEEISRRTARTEDAVRSSLYRAKRSFIEAAHVEGSSFE
jgi:RNA polymerase sigma-70 factor (ECF subfamily)